MGKGIMPFMKVFSAVFFLLSGLCMSQAQRQSPPDRMGIMFYNAENLFDTIDNPLTDDDGFTPQSLRRWTPGRYWNKLRNISRVIVATGTRSAPAVVGLCEVENDSVLYDLTRRSPLRELGYKYVVTSSPDPRGINTALLYRPGLFRLLENEEIEVDLSGMERPATRHILHVTGLGPTLDTLDIYVCHWPSRLGGGRVSEPRRHAAAKAAMGSVRRVMAERRKPFVILMGDLNEGPDDPAVRETLGAIRPDNAAVLPDSALVALMYGMEKGTYCYEGEWDTFDQFVVSASFLKEDSAMRLDSVAVCRFGFVLEEDRRYGGVKPKRTYNGYRYMNGFSDHLPVALWLDW